MIRGSRNALLGAGLLLAGPAMAAADSGHYVWVPAGATVVLVPSTLTTAVDFPAARMIARQRAMMDRVFADMDQLMAMPMPDPGQMIRSVMQGMPQPMPGAGVVVTSITTGNGTCSQTVTYDYPDHGGQPTVKVSSTGDACGVTRPAAPLQVQQPTPAPTAPRQERLWHVDYPAQPIAIGKPRT